MGKLADSDEGIGEDKPTTKYIQQLDIIMHFSQLCSLNTFRSDPTRAL